MTKETRVNTNNKGWLDIVGEFKHLRGIENKGKSMGKAKDKEGNIYEIYTAPCSLERCYCWATAVSTKK